MSQESTRGITRELWILGGVLLLAAFVGNLDVLPAAPPAPGEATPGQVAVGLGCLLLTAHLFGRVLAVWHLPMITGYLLAGVLLGPYALDVVGLAVRERLGMINQIALGLIALTAGGELAVERLRPRMRAIASITVLHAAGIFGATAVAMTLAGRHLGERIGLLAGLSDAEIVAVSLLVALIATATSPSSTVAVINESRAVGPLTTVTLGVTVLKDVVVIVMMAVVLSSVSSLLGGMEGASMVLVLAEVLVSLLVGAMVGTLLIEYLVRVGAEVALVLLGTVFSVIALGDVVEELYHFHLHFLLVCIMAGFVVENASAQGKRFIDGIERSSLPVYVIFFTLSGVGLDLASLAAMWRFALLFVVWRAATVWVTTFAGGWLAGEKEIGRQAWTGFVAQAGISLGLAELVATAYPGIGARVKTLVLASVAINQVIGPILFKWTLRKSGEAPDES